MAEKTVPVGGETKQPTRWAAWHGRRADDGEQSGARPRRLRWLWRQPLLILAILVIAFVVSCTLFPDLLATHDPFAVASGERLLPPDGTYWFGTDQLGRDIYSRVIYGSALTLQAAVTAIVIALTVGSLLGLLAGYFGRWLDDSIMRLVDVAIAIPGLLLALMIVTALGFGTINVGVAVGVATMANFARVMRAEVLRTRSAEYVEAATGCGVRWWSVLIRHVLRNSSGPVVVLALLEFGTAILAVSTLSFLGFGAEPPHPEWGSLVAEGRNYLALAPWMTTMPGLVIVAVVLAANYIAGKLERDNRERP